MAKKRKIKLPTYLIEKLIKMPETGMGYHKVDLILRNGEVLKNQLIINCSLLSIEETIQLKIEDVVDLLISEE